MLTDSRFPILKYFEYEHLPPNLREISEQFATVAQNMVRQVGNLGAPAEISAGLRKLLEAKDCFVRAGLGG